MDVGVRVIRGPNWKWDDQDGGCVGTLVRPTESSLSTVQCRTVFVQWDTGSIGNYRVGKDGEHDLRILDSAPAGVKFPGITCDECRLQGLIGTRWKCAVCDNYDLCHDCYHSDKHDLMHAFLRYETYSSKCIEVPLRAHSEKSTVQGIFPGATVVRRVEDWVHGQNDGGYNGISGTVLEDSLSRSLSCNRGCVMVLWENNETVEHRCGNDGIVAVKCIKPGIGKQFYLTHLANLDYELLKPAEDSEEDNRIGPVQSIDRELQYFSHFRPGDRVQVNVDVNVFRSLQDDEHGGWNSEMEMCVGVTGIVLQVYQNAVVVLYRGLEKQWPINPEALMKKILDVGDVVKIEDDEQIVKLNQKGHGGWVQKMKEILGKTAKVVGSKNQSILVKVDGMPQSWTLNPRCCTLTESDSDTNSDEEDDNRPAGRVPARFMIDALRSNMDLVNPQLLVRVAADNAVPLVKAIVDRYPNEVNIKDPCGRTALHIACLAGHIETVQVLLDAGADITAIDKDGYTPVHYSVNCKDNPAVLKILLQRGASADLVSFQLMSVLHLAAHQGHTLCVQTLVEHHCNVNLQDQEGDTALHVAILRDHKDVINCLVECSDFNHTIMNERGFNVLEYAITRNNCYGVERIVEAMPKLVNDSKADGFTPLHVACVNGRKEAADILITKGKASMEFKNLDSHTPLMIALAQAKISTIEVLIARGANPNTADANGDTCLHWIMKLIVSYQTGEKDLPNFDSSEALEISSIVTNVPQTIKEATWVGVALFFVKHGANPNQVNNSGLSPVQLIKDKTITDLLVKAYKK